MLRVPRLGLLQQLELLLGRRALVQLLPLLQGHAVHVRDRLVVAHVDAVVQRARVVPADAKEESSGWVAGGVPLPLLGRHHLERQLRQNPAKIMTSMFCTSVRMRRCSASFEKAYASASWCGEHDAIFEPSASAVLVFNFLSLYAAICPREKLFCEIYLSTPSCGIWLRTYHLRLACSRRVVRVLRRRALFRNVRLVSSRLSCIARPAARHCARTRGAGVRRPTRRRRSRSGRSR